MYINRHQRSILQKKSSLPSPQWAMGGGHGSDKSAQSNAGENIEVATILLRSLHRPSPTSARRRVLLLSIMKGTFEKAWGYQGDNMNLPVRDVAASLPFYQTVLGFHLLSRSDSPHNSAVLVRDHVRIGLAENGRDSTQDGCAFHVKGLEALFAEFKSNGLQKELSEFSIEQHDGAAWKVFYVVAPDGLCYWFGERQTG